MSAKPYMPFYIGDYLADAAHLSTTEHGAYMLLIMTYWQRGEALQADSKRLANIARMTPEAWAEIEPTIAEFFSVADGKWTHKRVEAELARYREKVEKAAAAGRTSAQRRSNGRSTDVEQPSNERSTDAQRTCNYPTPSNNRVTNPLPLEQDAARDGVSENIDLKGLGWVGTRRGIRPEVKRAVAVEHGLAHVEPLVAEFEAWRPRRPPRNEEALFRKFARSHLAKNPATRAACEPLTAPEPLAPKVIAKPSAALLASLRGKAHAH